MTLRFSTYADAALIAAHTAFATGPRSATWARLAATLTALENHARLFSDTEAVPFDPPTKGADAAEFFAMILDAHPPGPAMSITWSLDADEDVTIHLLNW